MSIFSDLTVACPKCGAAQEIAASDSVNADRRPDLREAILEGSFQSFTCPDCREPFRLEPSLNYLDVGRGQWLSAFESEKSADWEESTAQAREAFAESYGERAGEMAREIGSELEVRVVFGWPAMREKIFLKDLGLDDVVVEEMKLAMIRGLGGLTLDPAMDLRVLNENDRMFTVAQVDAATGAVVEEMRVPRAFYDEVAADPEAWATVRAALTADAFVDVKRLYAAL